MSRAILLRKVFCAIKQPNRIVFQDAAIDEYFVGFWNYSEEKWNRHGSSDGFRDRNVRVVSLEKTSLERVFRFVATRCSLGLPSRLAKSANLLSGWFVFFSMSFPIKSWKKSPFCLLNSRSKRLASRMIPKISSLMSLKLNLAKISHTSSTLYSSARRVALMASASAPLKRWIFDRMSSSSRLLSASKNR